MEYWPTTAILAVAGGLGGIVLGLAARLARFCTLAAIEDAMFGHDRRRLRMWALAMAISIVGVAAIGSSGLIDFKLSLYHQLALNPVTWILGGLMFGIGMAFCGTCAYGTLARIGGGDLQALFVFFVLGISAYMAIAGPTAELRASLLDQLALDTSATAPRTLVQAFPLNSPVYLPLLISVALAFWCLKDKTFRQSPTHLFWSIAVGLVIIAGWLATGVLGKDPFDPQPLVSYSFSAPLGQTLMYLMTMSSTSISFGIGASIGVVVGAFIGALIKRDFRWEGADDTHEMRRHLIGAFLMGTGGVYAGGCTIGQGLSAASLLAISAPFVLISIWCGAWLGLTYLMDGSIAGVIRSWNQK